MLWASRQSNGITWTRWLLLGRGRQILIMLKVSNTHNTQYDAVLTPLALRAMKEAAFTWGDVHSHYLAAAVHFADDFKGWTGFEFTEAM
jgi:hypothetical protein